MSVIESFSNSVLTLARCSEVTILHRQRNFQQTPWALAFDRPKFGTSHSNSKKKKNCSLQKMGKKTSQETSIGAEE